MRQQGFILFSCDSSIQQTVVDNHGGGLLL